jgi:acyl-CoA synthetase (AMP-forming)/AMP-acid ligase II
VAAALQKLELEPAEPVAIMLPSGTDYFFSFFGILMAGGIPVPIYPPARPSQIEDHIRRHARILDNCRASILITSQSDVPDPAYPGCRIFAVYIR